MLEDSEIVIIRQFCIDRAITILVVAKEAVTLDRHLAVAKEIEDFLMREELIQEPQLGRD